MGIQFISNQTKHEFREHMTDMYLSAIDDAFRNAGVGCNESHDPQCGGQRRRRVEQHYATLDTRDWTDAQLLLRVYEDLLIKASEESRQRLMTYLERDGFELEKGRLIHKGKTKGLNRVAVMADRMDAQYLASQIDRLHDSIASDPAAAIGGAKELIETCCKTILDDHTVEGYDGWEVPKLVKETLKLLKLTPENIPETARGKDSLTRMMSGLSMIAVSLAELRNEYGTGHGKQGRANTPKPRHAALAVGTATAFASFLLETHAMQQENAKAKATV